MAYFPDDRIWLQASFVWVRLGQASSRGQKMAKKPRIIDASTPKMPFFAAKNGHVQEMGRPPSPPSPKNAIPKPNWVPRGPKIWQRTHYVGPNAMWSKKCHSQAQLGFPRPMGWRGWSMEDHHLATDPLRGSQPRQDQQEDVM